MRNTISVRVLCALFLALVAPLDLSAAEISLVQLEDESAVVGRKITLAVFAEDAGAFRYRFRVRAPGGELKMLRDFGPDLHLEWAAEHEGAYEMEATVWDTAAGTVKGVAIMIFVDSRVVDGRAVVNMTDHPLVALFSAPSCEAGARMRVHFEPAGGGRVQRTPC